MNINFYYTNMAMAKTLGLGPAALFGWLTVVTNLPSGTCTASYDTIAEDFGVSRKTVQTWMNKLHTNGYIVRERVEGATYDITIPEEIKVSLEFNIKKPRKKADVPEAIAVVHGLYGSRYPKKDLWPMIIEKCAGKTPEQIAEVHAIWCAQVSSFGSKYNPKNPSWFDWVQDGVPERLRHTSPVDYKVTPARRVITDVDEVVEQEDGGTF
jgi:biotin operon repressor